MTPPSTGGAEGAAHRAVSVVETSIADLRHALESGATTSVALVEACLARIEAYDRNGIRLNSVVEVNPDVLAEAKASDRRRREGTTRGPLDGIPYTAKDSYMVRGMTVASGSPAFADLVARRDAFSIERLRDAGCVLIGLTNMPPMANGGMQRGLYGRAESPYNADYLTSAFGSGSSNGSGTATAASFAAFGLGEETWSSGRAPASNNALCAYTPSRGVVSVRGNWPLVPTMDVVVPHTRTMADLLEVLDVLVADDADRRGDFWRTQPWVSIPRASEVRPEKYPALTVEASASLAGKRFGIPAMYLGEDPDAGTGPGIGASTGQRIEPRPSLLDLWAQARADLEAAGAQVVVVDFPVVSNYEADRTDAPSIFDRGILPAEYFDAEIWDLSMWSWHDFLAANGQPGLSSLTEVDGPKIFPHPDGALPDRYGSFDLDISEYVTRARANGMTDPLAGPLSEVIRAGLEGLERTRRIDLEEWMDGIGIDVVVFPAVADVGPADADVNEESAVAAWRNGVWVANGNLAIRHLGIPTVTVPMGTMADIGMPVGLTFAGPAYSDTALLRWAAGFEALRPRRAAPPRTPEL
jgi:amidase